MRRLSKFLKWAGISLGALLALFVAINIFDEALEPGAAMILSATTKLKAEDNGYFYLAGMYASAPNNPGEIGERCVTAQIRIAQTGVLLSGQKEVPECSGNDSFPSNADSTLACDPRQQSCMKYYSANRGLIGEFEEHNKIVLERYGRLLKYKQFEDGYHLHPYFISIKFPPGKLYQAVSATYLQSGNALVFINRTSIETEFYRMVLRGENSTLYRMVGVAWLERSARLVSNAVQVYPEFSRQNQAELLKIVRPFTVSERNFEKAMAGEFRYFTAMLNMATAQSSTSVENWFYGLTVKPNATSNYAFRNIAIWRDLSRLPTEQYLAAEKPTLEKLFNPWRDGYLHWIFNPMGKTLAGMATPAYQDYLRRTIDVDGLLRLVSLQIQIAAQKIPESDIPAFLKNADPQFRDPYTGEPMQWDKTRGLYFRGYSDRLTDKDGFITVKT